MNRNRIVVLGAGSLAAVLAVALLAGQEGVAADSSFDERIRMLRTAPATGVMSHEERERNYRSCLFSFLPQVGSDAAAEMLRDACRDEYLPAEDQ
jgi:hypothetical protein